MTTGYDVIWSWAAKSKAWDAATSSASKTASTKENRRFQRSAIRLVQFHPGRRLFDAQSNVQTLHAHGEGHREVDVAFRDFLVKAFGHERAADEQQETQGEHFQRRMFLDKTADAPGENEHEHQRDDDRGHHYPELTRHTDRRDDRVERENDVEQQDLNDHAGKIGQQAAGDGAVLALKFFVNLPRAFPEQKQSAAQQNQIAARNRVRFIHQPELRDAKQRRGELDHPR